MSSALGSALGALVALGLGLGLAAATLLIGPGDLNDAELGAVFLRLRLYRAGAAGLAGAALSTAGVMAQALFRNPLASPSVLGATAGAALGGQLVLLLLPSLLATAFLGPEVWVPCGCFAGAGLALMLVLAIGRGQPDRISLILIGFVLSALFLALGGVAISLAQERFEVGRAVVAFALGGVSGAGPFGLGLALPWVLLGVGLGVASGPSLDLMLSGEKEAAAFGLDVRQSTRTLTVWIAVLVGAAVSVAGNLGFVGLVVPHAVRRIVGPTHRRLLPWAAFGGALFLILSDGLLRSLPTRSELPLGVVTSLVGAPLFLQMLLRMKREGELG
ncbi:MAG: iron ABC transporter permease [Myxococcota bacterium]